MVITEIIATAGIIAIGYVQLTFLTKGSSLIKKFSKIFTSHDKIEKVTLRIPEDDLAKLSGEELLANWEKYALNSPNKIETVNENAQVLEDVVDADDLSNSSELMYLGVCLDGKFSFTYNEFNPDSCNFAMLISSDNPSEAKIFTISALLDSGGVVMSRYKEHSEVFLTPVCDIQNDNKKDGDIITIEPGIVTYEDSNWWLTKRIKVKYN